jgi:uncharacterized protein DUF4169
VGELVNLKQHRKRLKRAAKRAQAAENAVRFGRSKAAREVEARAAETSKRLLDLHRRDGDD